MPRLRVIIVTLLVCMVLLLLLFVPEIPLYREHRDIDLNTGRARYTSVALGISVRRDIRHTPISKALDIVDLTTPTGDWHRVLTFTPGSHISPTYRFGSAFSDAQALEINWIVLEFSLDAQKESAATVLRLWKTGGNPSLARSYIGALSKLSEPVTISKLPPPQPSQ